MSSDETSNNRLFWPASCNLGLLFVAAGLLFVDLAALPSSGCGVCILLKSE